MRLATYVEGGPPRLAAVLGEDALLDLHGAAHALAQRSDDPRDAALPALVPDSCRAFLDNGPLAWEMAARVVAWAETQPGGLTGVHGEALVHALGDVRLCAPVPDPEKVIGIGLNYLSHAEEQNARLPKVPLIFAKWNNTLVGPRDPIVHPEVSEQLDYEAELAVVLGRTAHRVSEADALSYVAGYTILNDVTARDVQLSDRQWVRGKTMDTLAPCGPFLTTPDEVGDVADLRVELWVNDRQLQDGNTKSMIFSVAHLVSFLSHSFTLRPGDIIATGTPAGVGFKQDPPLFLRPGDVVRVAVDSLGELVNPVVSASAGGR